MRIAIPDDYQKVMQHLDCFSLLKGQQVTVVHQYQPDPALLAPLLKDPEALVLTRTRTPIGEELLTLLPNLKLISQTGKNARHIDVAACTRHGVAVAEGRGNPIATAELTWALIMNGLRLIPQAIEGMKKGNWQTNLGRRVYGKRIGIWGYGKIGQRIARYAQAFEAEVLVWGSETSRQKARADGFQAASNQAEFFQTADVVSLHLRLKETTRGIIREADLRLMKPTALFVNTARAALVEPGALARALPQGRPGFAALDVFEEEPIFDPQHPLLQLPNVLCTPHLGYAEKSSYELYFSIAFQHILAFQQGNFEAIINPEVLN
ncbi:MAG: D-2-hydroxyacid dehydrogenase family protein [Bacteroidota bacterium]